MSMTRMMRPGEEGMRWLRHAFIGGYRRADVSLALDNLGRQLEQMAESLNRVWVDRERLTGELAEARSELERERAQNLELTRSLEARGAEVENAARARVAKTLAEAEEQAE